MENLVTKKDCWCCFWQKCELLLRGRGVALVLSLTSSQLSILWPQQVSTQSCLYISYFPTTVLPLSHPLKYIVLPFHLLYQPIHLHLPCHFISSNSFKMTESPQNAVSCFCQDFHQPFTSFSHSFHIFTLHMIIVFPLSLTYLLKKVSLNRPHVCFCLQFLLFVPHPSSKHFLFFTTFMATVGLPAPASQHFSLNTLRKTSSFSYMTSSQATLTSLAISFALPFYSIHTLSQNTCKS